MVEIDNEKANVALRENYMQKLIGKLLPDFKTTDFRPVYNNNYSFDGHKEKFIEILNSYLENYSTGVDNDGNATGEPILVVQDVNTIRMRNTSDKNNGTGLNVYAITFTDCIVKYLTQNGDYSYITFNGAVGLPDIYVNFMDEDLVGTTFFGNYALVGNTGINITDGGAAIIKGNAYAGRASGLNIKGSTLDFTGSYLICGGSLNLNIKSKERQEHYLRHSLTLVALHSYGRMRLYLEIMPHLMELVQSMLRMTLLLRGMIQVQFLVVLMKALDMNLRKMQLIMTVVR